MKKTIHEEVREIIEKLIESEIKREEELKAGLHRRDGGRLLCIASRTTEIIALVVKA